MYKKALFIWVQPAQTLRASALKRLPYRVWQNLAWFLGIRTDAGEEFGGARYCIRFSFRK